MFKTMLKLTTVFIALSFGGSAMAHSFSVLLLGDTSADAGVYEAFRFASSERDGHANEESDGHLGGLDVYISFEPDYSDIGEFDFAVLLANKDDDLRARLEAADILLIDLAETTREMALEFVHSRQFERRFEADTGAIPGDLAILSYVASQIIDKAVRVQGGVDDGAALTEIIAKY